MDARRIGVIFDMDGVLIDSAKPHFRSWELLAEENGTVITEAQFSATFGQHNDNIVPKVFGAVSRARVCELADRKEELYRDLIRMEAPIVPGAQDLVRGLHDAGVSLAIGSSGPLANIELVVESMCVRDLIGAIVSGDDVTRGKPDPQVFVLACEALGISPARCVVVEDAPVGVSAARAAGTHVAAVLIYHSRDALADADLIADHLADLSVEQLVALASA